MKALVLLALALCSCKAEVKASKQDELMLLSTIIAEHCRDRSRSISPECYRLFYLKMRLCDSSMDPLCSRRQR